MVSLNSFPVKTCGISWNHFSVSCYNNRIYIFIYADSTLLKCLILVVNGKEMQHVSHFSIDLHKDTVTNGQLVAGCVRLTLTAPIKVRCISVRFHGNAKVHWSDLEGTSKNFT